MSSKKGKVVQLRPRRRKIRIWTKRERMTARQKIFDSNITIASAMTAMRTAAQLSMNDVGRRIRKTAHWCWRKESGFAGWQPGEVEMYTDAILQSPGAEKMRGRAS